MSEIRVSDPEAVTSPIFRIKGQRSTPVYPDPRLTPEHCEILRDVDIGQRGIVQSRFGYDTYNPTVLPSAERALGMWQGKFSNGDEKQVIVTRTKVYSVTASAAVDITGSNLVGGVDDRVQMIFLKDQLIINNSVDDPRVWAGNDTSPTNTADLATIPFTKCESMVTHQNLLMALGTTEGGTYFPTRIRWCNVNRATYVVDINTWTDLDRYEIYDGGTAIVGAVDAWGWCMIFKTDGLYPGRIIYHPTGDYDFNLGDPTTEFGPRRGFSPIAKHSFISRPEFIFGVAKEGIFIIQPDFSFQLVNSEDTEEWFGLNQDRLQYAQSYVLEDEHQVRTICSSANNNNGHDYELVWDWDTGDVWIDRPSVKKSYASRIVISGKEQQWFGGVDGFMYKGGTSATTDDNGSSIDWRIKTAPNDLGSPGKLKHIVNVRTLYRKRAASVNVTVSVHLDEGRKSRVEDTLVTGAQHKWNTGVKWNQGNKWPGAPARRDDTFVNIMAETLAVEWSGSQPASIEGYIVDYIPLEN